MKVIENLTLDISMTGAWSGDNIKVTAKVWNGKITKTASLSGSYSVDSISLDSSMYGDEYAIFDIVTSQYIGSSRNKHSTSFQQVNVRGVAIKGWEKAYGKRSNWADKNLGFADSVAIQVPGSTYDSSNTFTVSSPGISSITSSTNHGNFPYYINVSIKGSNNATAGPFGCDTRDVVSTVWEKARSNNSSWVNYDLEYGEVRYITVPDSSYNTFTSFKITGKSLDIGDIGSFDGHSNFPYERLVYVYDSHGNRIAGPFSCTTVNEYNEGWKRAANSEHNCITTSLNPGTSLTITVPTTTAGSTRQFTITAKTSGSGGGGGGSCCFPAGAPVLLADGTTAPIESLTLGTMVIGYDIDSGKLCENEIVKTIQKKHRSDIYEVQREDGVSFLMTANHVVLTKNGWKAIDAERGQHDVPNEVVTELTNEDELLRSDGNYVKINNIMYRDDLQDQNVYNIDVEENDTYIAYDIVVHNECSGGNE